jgi:hypothetical protein
MTMPRPRTSARQRSWPEGVSQGARYLRFCPTLAARWGTLAQESDERHRGECSGGGWFDLGCTETIRSPRALFH